MIVQLRASARNLAMLSSALLFTVIASGLVGQSPVMPSALQTAFIRSQAADPEAICQGLTDGSLVESVVFRRMYKLKNPLEDAIVVTVSLGNETCGIVVYTKAGQLYARSSNLANVLLPSFSPNDLQANLPQIQTAVRTLYASGPTPSAVATTTEAQLVLAYQLLRDYGDFPSARTLTALTFSNADGSSTTYPAGSIVFDWNNVHYFYHPQFGVRGQPIPTDPVTGAPYLCVKHGDLVESIAFYYNYLKTHPNEKATVLAPTPPDVLAKVNGKTFNWNSLYTWAAAAYTNQGKLYLRSYILGDVALNNLGPSDLNNISALVAAYKQLLLNKYKIKAAKSTHWNPASPATIEQAALVMGKSIPDELPGDNADMQLRRVHLTLKNLGGNMTTNWETAALPNNRIINFLLIYCEDRAYQYSPNYPTVHRGIRDRPNPSPLVAGLLFTIDYQKKHPTEKADIVLPTIADGVNAVALFTCANAPVGYSNRTLVFEAVLSERNDNVGLLIEAGADVSLQDEAGETPLTMASSVNNYRAVYMLLKSGADPLLKNRWGADLAARIRRFGDRGIRQESDQYAWYLKVVEEMKARRLLD